MVEEWRELPLHDGKYSISNMGIVKSNPRTIVYANGSIRELKGKIISQQTNEVGYKRVTLKVNNVNYNYFVHRIVALTFCPNPNDFPIVNHIDCDPSNNYYTNLEWCTQSHNIKHSYNLGRSKSPGVMTGKFGKDHNRSKAVLQYDLSGKLVAEFESATDAQRKTGMHQANISAVLNNKQKTIKGYVFKFKEI